MRLRSLLYVPASEKRFIAKAHRRGADAIILDLEDAVAPAHKGAARANLAASLASVGQAGAAVFVRINAAPETARLDIAAAHSVGATGLFVAKSSVASLRAADAQLSTLEQGNSAEPMRLVAMIEDPAALLEARDLARQARVMALIVGSEDLATALGGTPEPDVLRLPKQLVHYAAKAEGLLSFGLFRTVADFSDLAAIKAAAREAQSHGFDGATCVHPSSVPILNAAFGPSAHDIAWAQQVVAQAEAVGQGAFRLHDRMIDAPVLARARKILGQSGQGQGG
jgi:citrate lyase subunit beta / citryl-CoA lyase